MRHRLEYLLVAVVALWARHMPWRVLWLAGGTLGLLVHTLDGKRRRVTLGNLARAFPGRPAAERRRIARGVYRHFGRLALEVMKFSALPPAEMVSRVEVEGSDRVRQAYAEGRGVFFLTAHFGCWEMHGLAHSVAIAPIGVVARPIDNPLVNGFLERARQGTGNTVIYRKGGLRRILRAIESGQGVAILIDQHIHGADATLVDFFGRPAATTTALAALALRTRAPVVPVFAIPTAPGRYRLIYEHPVEMPAPDSPDAVRELTQRCTDVLEMYVRRYPQLWLWMHRRWRDAATPPAASGNGEPLLDADEQAEPGRGGA